MADIAGTYDPNAEAAQDFDVIPAGEYKAEIIESEIEDISRQSDKGRCLKLVWSILDGEFKGRLVWQRLNMWPENMSNMDKVTSIAQSQFASVRQATGKNIVQDSEELHHIPCVIKVGIRKDKNGVYNDQNEVKNVKACNAGATFQPPARQSASGSPPASNGGSKPWSRPAA